MASDEEMDESYAGKSNANHAQLTSFTRVAVILMSVSLLCLTQLLVFDDLAMFLSLYNGISIFE